MAYCLYEKTRKGTLVWKKGMLAEDGGLLFDLSRGSYESPCLTVYDPEEDHKEVLCIFGQGVKELRELIWDINSKPEKLWKQKRMAKYIQENC
jgi:hypothetical protein